MLPLLKPDYGSGRWARVMTWVRRRTSLLLPLLLLIPVGLIIRNETEALRDYEASFDAVAVRQLDQLSGTLNAEIWYAADEWQKSVNIDSPEPAVPVFVDAVARLKNRRFERRYERLKELRLPSPDAVLLRAAVRQEWPEPFYPVLTTEFLVLLRRTGTDTLVIFCNPESYAQRAVEPVLESLDAQNIQYELRLQGNRVSKAALPDDAMLEKDIWVLPGLQLRMAVKPPETEALAERRTRRALVLVGSAFAIVMLVVLGLERIIRREQQLSRLKSDFVANVSHELKTPLALIRMYGESLQLGRVKNDDQRNKYYGIIIRESERLGKLINNVLQLSRLEAGRSTLKPEPTDLNALVLQTVETFQEAFTADGFQVTLSLADNLPSVTTDPDAAAESLVNLIDNAMKYSAERKRITISTAHAGSQVQLSVRDEGIGISRNDQKRIFEQFYRVESSLTPKTRGTGIGLNLVRSYMEAQGGSVEVESEPGKGTTFTLHFAV